MICGRCGKSKGLNLDARIHTEKKCWIEWSCEACGWKGMQLTDCDPKRCPMKQGKMKRCEKCGKSKDVIKVDIHAPGKCFAWYTCKKCDTKWDGPLPPHDCDYKGK